MQIHGATALVTGANRGLGRAFAVELLRRGATVYAGARHPELVDVPGVRALRLDITDATQVSAAADLAGDVDLLINNAADTAGGNLITGDLRAIRSVMDTNYHGTLAMIRAFAPVLARNGGGAILNVLSAAAWTTVDGNAAYAASKSAEWGLTNNVRMELAAQGTHVAALIPGLIGTQTLFDFAERQGIEFGEGAVIDPADLVSVALDGLEAGEVEIFDALGRKAKESLSGPPTSFPFAV
ncbi:SDR family NAD(P)-dependent oxidoreductase [Mycobacterium sp. PSTR-4-N]|uniref:SDR family NAD(P)-dependent oxidoreductase n=1 Tax=Mycobacterium sp. PSTR-4-N TaxID=2917745 RepID=UPI001F155880|nr:SDR family NAD(P)-dependent oxidoreductase [Mycobacterium sp. PSTR-4-N]MCG7593874.1 SDR family NAD(P)-dependent oxidoreductase [Mycobacterium sp. PSTR-4-N]